MTQANTISLPSDQDVAQARESSRTLSKYTNAERVRLSIQGSNNETDDFILPGAVMQLLLNILAEMSRGNAISIMPIYAELSTQQAANLLNVSRPHLVKLLERSDLPFHKVGSHRRVLAQDLFAYKQRMDEQRQAALDALTALSQNLGMGYD